VSSSFNFEMNPKKDKGRSVTKVDFYVPPFLIKKHCTVERFKIVTEHCFYTMYQRTGDIVVNRVKEVSVCLPSSSSV
jgi:hypothetical protein